MTKLHTKQSKLTSRRAVAPVIATLLLVAIAVVGGSIIFVFSQGFFSSAQISGSPQIESVEIIGYDASDVTQLTLHDNNNSTVTDQASADDGLIVGDRIAVYVQNQSAQEVTFTELSLAGVVYDYVEDDDGVLENDDADFTDGQYQIVAGFDGTDVVAKQDPIPTLRAGEEATIMIDLARALSLSRDAQFKVETGTGSIFVGTILGGQQSG